jgi:hypothetical protein
MLIVLVTEKLTYKYRQKQKNLGEYSKDLVQSLLCFDLSYFWNKQRLLHFDLFKFLNKQSSLWRGGGGVFDWFKLFLPAFAAPRRGGGSSPCGYTWFWQSVVYLRWKPRPACEWSDLKKTVISPEHLIRQSQQYYTTFLYERFIPAH